ncbi:hypothetical protein [Labilibaculum manganireducens]|uniref:hypothetical protein n=1 Tax=Labilibaculum manganireducens TaxID=1940525 RepID=UPI0029F5466E|nr:hypothetical protein [Labilibaculum manganireducens]
MNTLPFANGTSENTNGTLAFTYGELFSGSGKNLEAKQIVGTGYICLGTGRASKTIDYNSGVFCFG